MKRRHQYTQLMVGVFLVGICLFTAILAPQLAPPENPAAPEIFKKVGRGSDMTPHPPNENALLGTMPGQLDIFYTVVWGMRSAFRFGLVVVLLTGTFGILYGAISAYLGRQGGQVMMRIADAFLTFPVIAAVVFLTQIIAIIMQNTGAYWIRTDWYILDEPTLLQKFLLALDPVLISAILFSWMAYARVVNSNVIRLKDQEFVIAARALGANGAWILIRHLLPNAIAPAVVLAARDVGGMVVMQTTFTFIGLGGRNPWGELISIGRSWVLGVAGNPFTYWWTFLPATIALVLFGLGWNFIGDGLNDWANPHQLEL